METLQIALGFSIIATLWLLPIGAIRMIPYYSGQADHQRGMRNLAIGIVAAGAVFAVTSVVLAVVVATR